MVNVYANNFLTASDKEYYMGNLVEDKSKKYWAWQVTSYSDIDPTTSATVYIDSQTYKQMQAENQIEIAGGLM